MPAYNALGFSVGLQVWDPQQDPSEENDEKLVVSDPSIGRPVVEVSEEYFDGCRGVDFLGQSGSPFFLVNAGRDLFFHKEKYLDGCRDINPPVAREALGPATTHGSTSLATPVTPRPKSTAFLALEDGIEDDIDSPLSSAPSNVCFSPAMMRSVGQGNNETTPIETGSANKVPKGWSAQRPKPLITNNATAKPLNTPLAIKIQAIISKKSFPRSLDNNELLDVSLNIFYNGEFAYSKAFRWYTMRTASAVEKHLIISGRRVGTMLEVPFMLMPLSKGADKSARSRASTNLEEQWNKINKSLLAEAEEWGRAGKYHMFRSPIGEYLEDLSKVPMPKNMAKTREGGQNIGIIDVVVALGRTVAVDSNFLIREPQRKLPARRCGKDLNLVVVPEVKRSKLRTGLIENFQSGETANNIGISAQITQASTIETSNALRISTRKGSMITSAPCTSQQDEEYHIHTVMKPTRDGPNEHRGIITSNQPLAESIPPPRMSLRSSQHRKETQSNSLTSMSTTSDSAKQDVPGNIPAKRYRGPSPVSDRRNKRRRSTLVKFPSRLASDAAALGSTVGQQGGEKNQRPVRRRTKSTHPDEMSPTPAGSSKRGNNSVSQTPTPGLDIRDSPSSHTRSSGNVSATPDPPAYRGSSNYNSKIFGMDGTADEAFDFAFGLDGSGPGSKSSSQQWKHNGRSSTGSTSKKGGHSETPDTSSSAFSNPDATATTTESHGMHLRSSPRDIIAGSPWNREDLTGHTHDNNLSLVGDDMEDAESPSRPLLPSAVEKVKRAPRRAISRGELKGLLESHLPTAPVDNSFGSSFTNSCTNRPQRKTNRKDKNAAIPKSETEGNPSSRLTAAVDGVKSLVVKGLLAEDWNTVQIQPATKPKPKSKSTSKATLANESLKSQPTLQLKPGVLPVGTSFAEQKKQPPKLKLKENAQPVGRSLAYEREQKKTLEELTLASKMNRDLSSPARRRRGPRKNKVSECAATSESQVENTASQDDIEHEPPPASTNASNESVRQTRSSAQKIAEATNPESTTNVEQSISSSAKQRKVSASSMLPSSSNPSANTLPETPSMSGPATMPRNNSNPTPNGPASRSAISALAGTRSKPNLTIQPGIANALTSRSYTHSAEGKKAPTPRSDSFPTIKKTPDKADDGFFLGTFEPPAMRTQPSSNAAMLPPASTPFLPLITPEEISTASMTLPNRSSSGMMSSPTHTTGPPLKTVASGSVTGTAVTLDVLPINKATIKNEKTSPPILPTSKPYNSRMSTEPSKQPLTNNPKPENQQSNQATTTSVPGLSTIKPTPATATSAARPRLATPSASTSTKCPSSIPRPRGKVVAPGVNWKPNSACEDSVLGFATKEQVGKWLGLRHDKTGYATRHTVKEKEGVFRAHSILMGVRYVFGADFEEDFEEGKEGTNGKESLEDQFRRLVGESLMEGGDLDEDMEM